MNFTINIEGLATKSEALREGKKLFTEKRKNLDPDKDIYITVESKDCYDLIVKKPKQNIRLANYQEIIDHFYKYLNYDKKKRKNKPVYEY